MFGSSALQSANGSARSRVTSERSPSTIRTVERGTLVGSHGRSTCSTASPAGSSRSAARDGRPATRTLTPRPAASISLSTVVSGSDDRPDPGDHPEIVPPERRLGPTQQFEIRDDFVDPLGILAAENPYRPLDRDWREPPRCRGVDGHEPLLGQFLGSVVHARAGDVHDFADLLGGPVPERDQADERSCGVGTETEPFEMLDRPARRFFVMVRGHVSYGLL